MNEDLLQFWPEEFIPDDLLENAVPTEPVLSDNRMWPRSSRTTWTETPNKKPAEVDLTAIEPTRSGRISKPAPIKFTRLLDLRTSTGTLSKDMLASRLPYILARNISWSIPLREGGHYQPDNSLRPSFEKYHVPGIPSYIRHNLAPAVNRRAIFYSRGRTTGFALKQTSCLLEPVRQKCMHF